MAMPAAYVYHPLATATTIRILILQPGEADDPLDGSLVHENPGTRHNKYDALSYVWGPPILRYPITLDGGTLLLTKSLDEALRRLRLPVIQRRLWADAICINQNDVQERSAQVQMMGDIFQHARHVLIWLGHDVNSEAEEAFANMRVRSDTAALPVGIRDAFVKSILGLEWFKRVWVIQEAVIALKATFLWGDAVLEYEILQSRASMYNRKYTRAEAIWFGEMRYLHGNWDMFHALDWTRGLRCTDDRDRIYALLGLPYTSSVDSAAYEVVKAITPDYTKTVTEVYTEFASECVKRGLLHRLWLLVSHDSSWDPTNDWVPSWVPDLSKPPLLFNSVRAVQRLALRGFSEQPRPSILPPKLDQSGQVLLARGYILGTVRSVTERCIGEGSLARSLNNIALFWTVHVRQMTRDLLVRNGTFPFSLFSSAPSEDFDSRNCSFLECLTSCVKGQVFAWDNYNDIVSLLAEPANVDYGDELTTEAKMMLLSFSVSRCFRRDVTNTRQYHQRKQIAPDIAYEHLRSVWECHKLYTLSSGQVGLGPMAMRVNDAVVLTGGARHPIVLRPHRGNCYFVGYTYVSGVSDWEVESQWNKQPDLSQTESFEIR